VTRFAQAAKSLLLLEFVSAFWLSMKYFVAELEAAGIRLVDTKVVHRFFDLYAYVLEFDGDALTALGGRSARQAPRPSKQHQPVLIPVRVL